MRNALPLLAAIALLALPLSTSAQVTFGTEPFSAYGMHRGDLEIPVTMPNGRDEPFEDFLSGLSAEYRYQFATSLIGLQRQPRLVLESIGSEPQLTGASRVSFDRDLSEGAFRPFVSININRFYGEGVDDAWAAGIEGGAKYFVMPRTFLHATVEYGWMFNQLRGFNERFTDGQWTWSMGLGFNF